VKKIDPSKPILSQTKDFLRVYLHSTGESEVPKDYHLWAGVSLLAATLGDQVGVSMTEGAKVLMRPNLYVFLVGDSGSKKSTAIDHCKKIARPLAADLGLYTGMLTKAAMVEHYGCRDDDPDPQQARIWLASGELGAQIGDKAQATPLLKFMTDYQSAVEGITSERTATRGLWLLHDLICNWLAGSTMEWLIESIPQSAVEGGLVARICTILGTYPTVRYWKPIMPPDYDEVIPWLQSQLRKIHRLRGEFTLSPEAESIGRRWYETGEEPEPQVRPWWSRRQAMALKLSLIYAASSPQARRTGVITETHMKRAIQSISEIQENVPEMVFAASMGSEQRKVWIVESLISKAGRAGIWRSELCRQASKRSVLARDIDLAIAALEEQEKIETEETDAGTIYRPLSA